MRMPALLPFAALLLITGCAQNDDPFAPPSNSPFDALFAPSFDDPFDGSVAVQKDTRHEAAVFFTEDGITEEGLVVLVKNVELQGDELHFDIEIVNYHEQEIFL